MTVTGMTLTDYMTHSVTGTGVMYRRDICETFVTVVDDLQCTESDREYLLNLVDHTQEVSQSFFVELHEVVRRLVTNHRDLIYLYFPPTSS